MGVLIWIQLAHLYLQDQNSSVSCIQCHKVFIYGGIMELWDQASLVAQTVKRLPAMRETPVRFLVREDPLEKEMAIHSSTLPEKSHRRRSLIGYSPWGHKELDTTERLHNITL